MKDLGLGTRTTFNWYAQISLVVSDIDEEKEIQLCSFSNNSKLPLLKMLVILNR